MVSPKFQRFQTCGSAVIAMPSKSPIEAAEAAKPSIEAVFEAEEAPLVRYAYGVVGRREVAEELVQDAFMRLHEHWDTVEKPRPWLYRCVRNRAFNHLRDHKREFLNDPATTDEQAAAAPDDGRRGREAPDEVLGRMEAAGLVRMLMDEMNERDRELVHLKYFEDLKYSGISERTGMSVGNVGYRLHHILKSLAASLRRVGIEGAQP